MPPVSVPGDGVSLTEPDYFVRNETLNSLSDLASKTSPVSTFWRAGPGIGTAVRSAFSLPVSFASDTKTRLGSG